MSLRVADHVEMPEPMGEQGRHIARCSISQPLPQCNAVSGFRNRVREWMKFHGDALHMQRGGACGLSGTVAELTCIKNAEGIYPTSSKGPATERATGRADLLGDAAIFRKANA